MYAVNKYNIKSKLITIAFTKDKTFWQQLWIQVVLIIIAAVIIWLLFKLRIKAVKANANEKFIA